MIKKGLLLTAVVLLSSAAFVQAGEATRDDIGVSVSGTYLSRYIWYGFDLFRDNHSGFQGAANFDLYGTGWMFDVRWTRANSSGYENWEQLDYTLSYGGTINPDSTCVTNWRVGWRYYNHPDGPVRASDGCSLDIDRQEFFGTFSWPEITGCGVVPSYTVVYVKPDESGRKSDGCPNSFWRQGGGFIQVLGLAKEVDAGALCSRPDQKIRLSADLVHNGSVGGRDVDHDWSHVNWGVQTTVPMGENTSFTPGIVYQTTMDDSVNWGDGDEWWFFLTLTHLCN